MRSVKGIIIGFLLILLGFAAAQYSMIAAGVLSAGGLAVVIVSALPKRAERQSPQAAPAPPAPAPAELSAPELLPDILTDPPVQPEPPALPKPEAEALYKTLAEAYTRIEALPCRGPAWMLERDIRLCRAFCARWDGAKADAQTAALLREKARFRRSAGGSERRRSEADRAAADGAGRCAAGAEMVRERQKTALPYRARARRRARPCRKAGIHAARR